MGTSGVTTTSLQGKTVVVIGGTTGIGFGIAEAAAAEGASIVIGSSSYKKVAAAVERLPKSARGLEVDVTDEASVAGFFAETGPLDHLAFTAGDFPVPSVGTPAEADIDRFAQVMAVRLFGSLRAVKYAVRSIDSAGSITLTSGAQVYRPSKGSWHVSALGSLNALAAALAVELAPVRVNVVSPGFILNATQDGSEVMNQLRTNAVALLADRLPINRPGQPFEAAQAYLYAMKSPYTTGQEIRVDGGLSLV